MTYEWLLSKKDEGKQTHSFILLHTSHHMMDYETRGPWAQTCKKKKKTSSTGEDAERDSFCFLPHQILADTEIILNTTASYAE